jgi:sterol-4alpha-carboxylate 3-dehydrogenase (decarboxylating)
MKACAIRTNGVIGANDQNIIPLVAKVPRGINIGPGTNLADFTGVGNVALGHVLAVENLLASGTANGLAFYITDGHPRTMRQVLEMIWTELDNNDEANPDSYVAVRQYPHWVIPVWLICTALRVINMIARLIGKNGPLTINEIGDGASQRYFDITRSREILGYVPVVPLEQSVRDACRSYKKRNRIKKDN